MAKQGFSTKITGIERKPSLISVKERGGNEAIKELVNNTGLSYESLISMLGGSFKVNESIYSCIFITQCFRERFNDDTLTYTVIQLRCRKRKTYKNYFEEISEPAALAGSLPPEFEGLITPFDYFNIQSTETEEIKGYARTLQEKNRLSREKYSEELDSNLASFNQSVAGKSMLSQIRNISSAQFSEEQDLLLAKQIDNGLDPSAAENTILIEFKREQLKMYLSDKKGYRLPTSLE